MKKHNLAFTLIELLIAILIFSIIATVIYSTFSTGTSVWKRTKDANRVSMNINSVLQDLAKHLRGAVAYTKLDFIGENDKLYFCYLEDTFLEDSHYTEVYRSCYFIKENALVERKAPIIKGGYNIDEIPEQVLINDLDDFKIEYGYKEPDGEEILWEEEWENSENPDDIPGAIRVKVTKGDIILTKHIWVPTGKQVVLEEE